MARPRKISDEDVLLAALRVFWRDGYAGASLADLETEAGLNRRGLANRFGDKRGLLLETLRVYGMQAKSAFLEGLSAPAGAPGAGLSAIRAMFGAILEFCIVAEGRQGCLIVNLTREPVADDPEVKALIDSYFEVLDCGFADALDAAEAQGELAAGESKPRLRAFLAGTLMGLFCMARAGADPAMLRDFIGTALERLGREKTRTVLHA